MDSTKVTSTDANNEVMKNCMKFDFYSSIYTTNNNEYDVNKKDTDIVEMGTKINLAIEKYPKGLRKRVEQYQTENIVNNYYEISKKWSKNED